MTGLGGIKMSDRTTYIGGPDMASILGCGFRKPLEVYADKIGVGAPVEVSDAMLAGQLMEPVICEMVERKTGEAIDKGYHVKHREYPFLAGSPDGVRHAGQNHGYEFKLVTNDFIKKEFGDGEDNVPARYLIQVQWYAMLTGISDWTLAAFFATTGQLKMYEIKRDNSLGEILIRQALNFWREHIEKRIPPPESDPAIVSDFLKRYYPGDTEPLLKAETPEAREMFATLARYKNLAAEAGEREEEAKNSLKQIIGAAAGIEDGCGNKCTWKASKDTQKIDWEAIARFYMKHSPMIAEPEIIRDCTRTIPGARRFLASGPLFKKKGDDNKWKATVLRQFSNT